MLILLTECLCLAACCVPQTATGDDDRIVTRSIRGIVTREDGTPAANFAVGTPNHWTGKQMQTRTSDRGSFTLRIPPGPNIPLIQASSPDGSLLGSFASYERKRLLRITVKPKHIIECTVRDAKGELLEGADVGVIARYVTIGTAVTDAKGSCRLNVPADSQLDWIYAKKDGHGLNYHEHYTVFPTTSRPAPPHNVVVRLGAATTCTIKLVGSDGKPVAGVPLIPWTIDAPGSLSYCNLSGATGSVQETTGADGVATFRWLPRDTTNGITFLIRNEIHHTSNRITATGLDQELEATVQTRVRVSGTVRHADGSPAAGVQLQGESSSMNYFRGYTKTNAKGEYHFDIYPDQSTTIQVTDGKWASVSQSVTLASGEPKTGVDFKLVEGAIVSGKITTEEGAAIDGSTHVTIISDGRVVQWFYVDGDGNYSARLGPGSYTISMPGSNERKSITVKNGDDIVCNGTLAASRHYSDFEGLVVDADGQPVAGAMLFAAGTNPGRVGYRGKTDRDGKFWLERQDSTAFVVLHPTKPLALQTVVPMKLPRMTFTLQPAGSVTGQLVDPDKKPLANSQLTWAVSLPGFQQLRIQTQTDAGGRFNFKAVPEGLKGQLGAIVTKPAAKGFPASRHYVDVKEIAETSIEAKDLGELVVEVPK